MINRNKILVIAEAGVNHNGSLANALKMVDVAAKAGADFIKFQNWQAEELVTSNAKMAPYQIKNTKKKTRQINLLKPLELKKKYYSIKLIDSSN